MTPVCTLPSPVRSFEDPSTGVTIHQLTDGPEPSAHLYFTRCTWLSNGQYFVMVRRRGGAVNFCAVGPDGGERQVTHLSPPEFDGVMPHMHRRFFAWEGESLLMRLPAVHPSSPLLVYTWSNEAHLVDVEAGTDELLHVFPDSESEQPFTGLHASFTADGRDVIFTATRRRPAGEDRIDPASQVWRSYVRDESGFVSAIWRYDFQQRLLRDRIFVSNGEQSHLLTCPWDADLLLWVNYLHGTIYTARRDGGEVRPVLSLPDSMPGHYNWDVANRRLSVLLSDVATSQSDQCSLDIDTGEVRRLKSGRGIYQWHQNVSPDGHWIVTDAPHLPVGGDTGLNLIDQRSDTLHALCRINCSWNPESPDDGPLKSEFLHPNPSWSPDGRYVIFSSDFGKGVDAVQVYAVDVGTRKGG